MNKKSKVFINLTNGIEAIDKYNLDPDNVSFLRIQSSHCEGHSWDRMLLDLDNNLLMHLALGYECIVYDFGAHTEYSKAVYIGLEWIKYCLNRRWFNRIAKPIVKGKDISNYFEVEYAKLSKYAKKKIDYYKKFLLTDEIKLNGISTITEHDNKNEYYIDLVKDIY